MNKKLVGAAVAGAAVVAVVVVLVASSGGEPAAAPPPASTAAAPPAQQAKETYGSPAQPGSETGGFGIEIPVPAGWAVTHDKDHASYRQGDLLLETDRVPIAQEDALSGLQAIAKASPNPGTVTKHDDVGGNDAAEWDFTFVRDGVVRQVEVVGVGFGDALITIRYEAPQPTFPAHLNVLTDALEVSSAG